MSKPITRKQQEIKVRQIKEQDAIDAITASYASEQADSDKADRWVMVKRLQLNSLMTQEQIDELGAQLAGLNSEQQRAIVQRWIDAYAMECLAITLTIEKQAFGARIARKIARRLRDANGSLGMAESEVVGLAASYPRHREEIEKLYLATPDVSYQIAIAFGDSDYVPF